MNEKETRCVPCERTRFKNAAEGHYRREIMSIVVLRSLTRANLKSDTIAKKISIRYSSNTLELNLNIL